MSATYDGTTVRLYVNGVLDATAARSLNTAINADGLMIGNSPLNDGWHGYFNGYIHDVKVYNRALAATEVSKMAGTYPDDFSFTSKTSSTFNAPVESDPITVSGITQPAPISINVGMYSVSSNGTNWSDYSSTTPATVSANDQVKVRLTSPSNYGTPTTATLNIGGRTGTFSVTTVDTEKPVVTAFSVAVSESFEMTIGVTFTATDNHTINGYMITTSSTPPSATDPGWSTDLPTTFTLTTAGPNTIYAWAKDAAGNVSNPIAGVQVILKPVRRDKSPYIYYDSISAACSAAASGETIKALAVTVPESVTISKTLTIKGGHADGYGSQPGVTTIQGTLTIGTGSLIVDRVAVR